VEACREGERECEKLAGERGEDRGRYEQEK
jgi:hypothetical protein